MRFVHTHTVMACFAVSACAIHPQTEDFSRSAVPDIVAAIKCEAQRAILTEVPPESRYLFRSGLGLAFYFEMTENNDKTANGSFTFPVTQGVFRLGYSAGIEKERKSTQRVSTVDLFTDILSIDCQPDAGQQNVIYPITGNIGLQTTFNNYVRVMSQHTNASPITEFNDEVQFITALSGSVTPSIDLRPVSGRLIDARLNLQEGRIDIHRVKLSFTPSRTAFQDEAALRKAERDRAKELARIREERRIPVQVQIVDAKGNVIESFTESGQPKIAPPSPRTELRQRAVPPAAGESDADLRRRTLEDLERSERKAFEERFTREFER